MLGPSCQLPSSARPGQDHPEGHFWSALWLPPPQGRLQVSQTPKVPLGEPIWRQENKVEIAQAASQRLSGVRHTGPGKEPADTLMGWGSVGRGGSHFPSCQPQAARASPAPTAATGTEPVTIPSQASSALPSLSTAVSPSPQPLGNWGVPSPFCRGEKNKAKSGKWPGSVHTARGSGGEIVPGLQRGRVLSLPSAYLSLQPLRSSTTGY